MVLYLIMLRLALFVLAFSNSCLVTAQTDEDGLEGVDRFKIEGIVERPDSVENSDKYWFANTRVYTNTGYTAFLRENGSFVLHNLPWGYHYLHVVSPNTAYAPIRIDISPRGKWRLRRVNILQPSKVDVLPLPLKMSPLGPVRYFQDREHLRITDMLFNPMVLMSVLPLALLLILPKFSDADTRKEVEAQLPKTDTPDLAEFMTNLFKGATSGGGGGGDARRRVGGSSGAGLAKGGRRKEK